MDENAVASGAATGAMGMMMLVYLAVVVLFVVAGWKIFEKAGKPGWAVLVPFYNVIVMLEIVGRPLWWIVLMLIPLVNFVIAIILTMDLAVSFGKSKGWGIVLLFLFGFVGFPMLAFGDAKYVGPAAKQA
jgi:hypothetical protein